MARRPRPDHELQCCSRRLRGSRVLLAQPAALRARAAVGFSTVTVLMLPAEMFWTVTCDCAESPYTGSPNLSILAGPRIEFGTVRLYRLFTTLARVPLDLAIAAINTCIASAP